jgi:hypothetical protein
MEFLHWPKTLVHIDQSAQGKQIMLHKFAFVARNSAMLGENCRSKTMELVVELIHQA